MSKRKVLKVIDGPNGEKLEITEITFGRRIPKKEAIQRGLIKVSKKEMQKLFSEEELEEMEYNYSKTENDDINTNESETEN
jgi:hypothetical protein